jgi:Matrixin/Carboxypeptidase regulatory-like domain
MRFRWILLAVVLLASTRTGSAYKLIEHTNPNGQLRFLKWGQDSMPVPWFFHNMPPKDFPLDSVIQATRTSFDTWENVETSGITFQYSGTTNAEPFVFFDNLNTIGFIDDPSLAGTGVLGATNFIVFLFSGEIAESDIFFNNAAPWSVAANGQPGRFDFQSTATHEIGHFLGLDHSALAYVDTEGGRRRVQEGSAIMFPIAFPSGTTIGRTLTADDITGASVLYPAGNFETDTGRMSGRVTKNGEGVQGAHVTTYNPFTGELIGAFTDAGGNYEVEGLSPGPIVVRVHPISDSTSPSDYGYDDFTTDLNYKITFYQGRADVTAGSETTGVDVAVTP